MMVVGFLILVMLTIKVHYDAPPIPDRVVDPRGTVVFTAGDIQTGQEVFLKHGLMNNGSIWGHGGYLGPDFSAQYLHNLAVHLAQMLAEERHGTTFDEISMEDGAAVEALVRAELKTNRFETSTATLIFTDGQADSYRRQIDWWADYFLEPAANGGLPAQFITRGAELDALTAFFAWTAWASVTNRPGETASYTNNFPYDPLAGNLPTGSARTLERAQPHRTARWHCARPARVRQVRLSRLEGVRRLCRVAARAGQPWAEPARRDEVLRHRRAAVPRADARRRRDGALSRRAGELLRLGCLQSPTEQYSARLASTARNFLDRDRVRGRCVAARVRARRTGAEMASDIHQHSVRRFGLRCRRQLARAMGRNVPVASRVMVLARSAGLGVSGARPGLADWARGGARVLVLPARAHVAPALQDPNRRTLARFFLIAAGAIPVFYLPAMLLRQHDAFLHCRHVALLDHPFVGRGVLRVLRNGARRRDFCRGSASWPAPPRRG